MSDCVSRVTVRVTCVFDIDVPLHECADLTPAEVAGVGRDLALKILNSTQFSEGVALSESLPMNAEVQRVTTIMEGNGGDD